MTTNDATSEWPYIFIDGPGPVIIALHGTGGTEADAAPLAEELLADAAVIAPRGRVTENGMSRWFRRLEEGVFDVDNVIVQAESLRDFVERTIQERHLEGRPVITAGFSNGANMGLALAILHPDTVQGAVAFSGMYPLGDREAPKDLTDRQFLLLNGQRDAMAPASSVNRLEDQLHRRNAHVDRNIRPGGHGITPEELSTARGWLQALQQDIPEPLVRGASGE